jgi:hypothetical protein
VIVLAPADAQPAASSADAQRLLLCCCTTCIQALHKNDHKYIIAEKQRTCRVGAWACGHPPQAPQGPAASPAKITCDFNNNNNNNNNNNSL